MSNVLSEFAFITNTSEKLNSKNKDKRFHPMTNSRRDKIIEVGLYDSKTKKYALTDVRAFDAMDVIAEMKAMLNTKHK